MGVSRIIQASKSFFVDPLDEMDDVINFLLAIERTRMKFKLWQMIQ